MLVSCQIKKDGLFRATHLQVSVCRLCRRSSLTQCMTARPAHSISIAELPGVAVLDHGRLVVLSCEAELAAHYTAHAPAPGQFSLQQPYQATAGQDVPEHAPVLAARSVIRFAASASGAVETPPGGCDEASETAPSDAPAGTAGRVTTQPTEKPVARRKRKRKAAKAPNEAEGEVGPGCVAAEAQIDSDPVGVWRLHCLAEQMLRRAQAARRHATFRPALEAAQAALQQWLKARCATAASRTLAAALRLHCVDYSVGVPPTRPARPIITGAEDRVVGDVAAAESVRGAGGLSAACDSNSGAAAPPAELDFAALGHMKQAVRPMLSWDAAGITAAQHGQSSAASVMARSCRAEEQQDDDLGQVLATNATHGATVGSFAGSELQRCNLYDVLVHNDGAEDAVALAHEVLRQAPVASRTLLCGRRGLRQPLQGTIVCSPLMLLRFFLYRAPSPHLIPRTLLSPHDHACRCLWCCRRGRRSSCPTSPGCVRSSQARLCSCWEEHCWP